MHLLTLPNRFNKGLIYFNELQIIMNAAESVAGWQKVFCLTFLRQHLPVVQIQFQQVSVLAKYTNERE